MSAAPTCRCEGVVTRQGWRGEENYNQTKEESGGNHQSAATFFERTNRAACLARRTLQTQSRPRRHPAHPPPPLPPPFLLLSYDLRTLFEEEPVCSAGTKKFRVIVPALSDMTR